jgi:hypothetical protein
MAYSPRNVFNPLKLSHRGDGYVDRNMIEDLLSQINFQADLLNEEFKRVAHGIQSTLEGAPVAASSRSGGVVTVTETDQGRAGEMDVVEGENTVPFSTMNTTSYIPTGVVVTIDGVISPVIPMCPPFTVADNRGLNSFKISSPMAGHLFWNIRRKS